MSLSSGWCRTVERSIAWLRGCRRLHRRYECNASHFLALTASIALEQAKAAGKFTRVHEASWTAARAAHGEAAGARALMGVLLLGRHMEHEHVVAGLAAAHWAGALTADAVALEARKAARPHQRGSGASLRR